MRALGVDPGLGCTGYGLVEGHAGRLRIREAGAIIIAKTNMAEFAWSPVETVGSMLPGYTRNPYSLNRVTAGSSGGTAAAVAASFAAVIRSFLASSRTRAVGHKM